MEPADGLWHPGSEARSPLPDLPVPMTVVDGEIVHRA
jgi:hypothetical protein